MALSDIADGLEVTAEQRDRGVATVDDTARSLTEQLATVEDDLPCSADAAATVVESYTAGQSVGACGRAAGVAPMTAAKTLHLLGLDGVSPLGPRARDVVRDWLAADLSRADALALTGASETEFALATFVETHDPLDDVDGAVADALSPDGDATVRKREHLAETMSGVGDLR